LDFTVSVDPGAPWLTVSPVAGTVTPASPETLSVSADASGLAPGTYMGSFTVSGGSAVTVLVTMSISTNASAFLLSQAGLSSVAVEQGGPVPPQNIGISNLGTVPLRPTVDNTTLSGGKWLLPALVADASGSQSVDVTVDASRLTRGRYYGLVAVRSPGAAN